MADFESGAAIAAPLFLLQESRAGVFFCLDVPL
jgi:hypothetical protein